MLPKLINLTYVLVIQELEEIMKTYAEHPYKIAFSSQELRQKLILRVLGQIPNHYTIFEEAQELPKDLTFLYSSFEEWMQMESLIHESIVHLVGENDNSISRHIPQKNNLVNEPSLWFCGEL